MPEKIGIIGLGRVGLPAAKAYLESGYEVFGYDIQPETNSALRNLGGHVLESPDKVAGKSRIVLIMVLNDDQVKEVISGDNGLLKGVMPGSIIVCMSTINRSTLEFQAKRCLEKKVGFVDCPFTGGPARIPAGSLTLIAAANGEQLNSVRSILEVIGTIIHVGHQPGMGQAVKHCNQLLVGVTHAATMEVIAMARQLGLDATLVSEVIASGIAGSDYFRLLSESVLKNKPSPGGLGQMCKDVSIVINTTKEINMPAYAAVGASKYFALAETMGMQNREGADLYVVVEKTIDQKKETKN